MLTKTPLHFNIDPIIEQVTRMDWSERSIALNSTTGNLLNGVYKVKPEFDNTPLGNVVKWLGDIGEARLLKLESGETYTAHTDPDDRLHMSIISNDFCYLANLESNTLHHLPVDGHIWEMDTGIRHSAMNLGGTPRIHLNIRKKLPAFSSPGYKLTAQVSGFTWKQDLYLDTMRYVNQKVKQGEITGFSKVDDKTILINCQPETLNFLINNAQLNGFEFTVTEVLL